MKGWPVTADLSGSIVVLPDIHGNLPDFRRMLRHCGAMDKKEKWAGKDLHVVQLGDLIDRQPGSRDCVDLALRLEREAGSFFAVLRGNHEDMMLRRAEDPKKLVMWAENGGAATLASYGREFEALCSPGGQHFEWLAGRPYAWQAGNVLFAHAGLNRKNPRGEDLEALLWSRPPLVRGVFDAVFSGHTPVAGRKVEEKDGVFQCDIGLGFRQGGILEYAVLEMKSGKMTGWELRKVPENL